MNKTMLAGTLEGEKIVSADQKRLPARQPDRLARFGDVIKMITEKASRTSRARGLEAFSNLEGSLEPSQMSGGTFASIIDLVNKQKTRGISDIYQSTTNMIRDMREDAKNQLKMLVSTGAISALKEKEMQGLADTTGIPLEQLQAYQTVVKTNDNIAISYTQAVQEGKMNIESVPADHRDSVIQSINWDKVPNKGYKFSSSDKGRLLATGLTNMDIYNLENDISEGGIESVREGLSKDQQEAISQILEGLSPAQVIKEEEKKKEGEAIPLGGLGMAALIKELKGKIEGGKLSRSLVQTTIDSGEITNRGKKYSLTPEQQTKIQKEIRSFWQIIMPGGR